eukprot:5430096-Amphidinium_carterae.2
MVTPRSYLWVRLPLRAVLCLEEEDVRRSCLFSFCSRVGTAAECFHRLRSVRRSRIFRPVVSQSSRLKTLIAVPWIARSVCKALL